VGFTKITSKALAISAGLFLLSLIAPLAKADAVLDFSCSGTAACNGTITNNAGVYSSTGITVYEGTGFYNGFLPFTVAFNTSTDMISITGWGQTFEGTLTQFQTLNGLTTSDVDFSAVWPTIPTSVQNYFGTTTGADTGFAIYLDGSGDVTSMDITITPNPSDPTPTPEPSSLANLGAGLLGLGFMLKRKGLLAV
jgi:hypothetical protein